MLLSSNPMLDEKAPYFDLPATDGKHFSYADVAGESGTVIAFICNHCPYVVAIIERFVEDARTLQDEGFGVTAICSNDAISYPQDSFENMDRFAKHYGFSFPYLHDESQNIAKAYDAVCTPDIYGISKEGVIKYRGRLDAGRMDVPPIDAPRELLDAMRSIAETGEGPETQHPSIGCSIKWK